MSDLLPFVDNPRNCIMAMDPGVTGAIAFLDTVQWQLGVIDMPTLTRTVSGKDRPEPSPAAISAILREIRPILFVCERMHNFGFHPNPDDLMKLGRWRGQAEGMAFALEIGFEDPTPSMWKAKMGLSANKEFSRNRAAKLFPACVDLFARAKDHDRAEAAILALYGALVIGARPTKAIGRIPLEDGIDIRTMTLPSPRRDRPAIRRRPA